MRNEVIIEGIINYKKEFNGNTFLTIKQENDKYTTYIKCTLFNKRILFDVGDFVKVTGKVTSYLDKVKKVSQQSVVIDDIVLITSPNRKERSIS